MKKLLYALMVLSVVTMGMNADVVTSSYKKCLALTGTEQAACIQQAQNEEPGAFTEWTGE